MGGEGRVGVPVERGKTYRMCGADAPLGGRLLSFSQITPRPLAERRSLDSPSTGAFE